MTDSPLSISPPDQEVVDPSSGKRERLIASATKLLHEQGVEKTTLAEIAAAADVPPGNVYYYFKTRDDLVRAVIEARAATVRGVLAELDRRSSPCARLKALARSWARAGDSVGAHGCPIGSLCSELNNLDGSLGREAADLLRLPLEWSEEQFRQMGCRDPGGLALGLMSSVQGAALLADTFDDPGIMVREARRLERWIDSLA